MKISSYYYEYLGDFISFLVPKGNPDYVVLSDVLGRVYDVGKSLNEAKEKISSRGRIVITQYSALWEPILRLATALHLRKSEPEQNWLSIADIENFAKLAGLEQVKSGTKMIFPWYIPIISEFLNHFLSNIWPFSHLGLFHFVVLRKTESRKESSLSIIVPARNEAGTIRKIVEELPNLGAFTELIFIEGNSTDKTYEEIVKVSEEFKGKRKIKYAKQEGKGKGDAVRLGFDMAEGEILAIYDADMTVPANEIRKFYEAMVQNKGDFINGSRLIYPMRKESMRVLNFLANKFFGLSFSWILNTPIKDTLCGTKVLWKSDYEAIKKGRDFFGDFDPFGDFDLLFGAAKLNLFIVDLPIHYQERIYGATNISRWKHGWLLLKMTFFAASKLKFI